MKFKFKTRAVSNSPKIDLFKKPFLVVTKFFRNLKASFLLMTKTEKMLALILAAIGCSLLGYSAHADYIKKTVLAPDNGGEYIEAVAGDVKFLSPVTAQNDAEKSVAALLFPGLIKIGPNNTILPDLAESYSVSDDGRIYTFHLRQGILWSDGQPISANDIAYTLSSIQAPELKSPLYTTFADVTAKVIDDRTIELDLQTAYGPFIYKCDFGIIPSHLASDDFSKRLISAGPFQFTKSVKDGTKIKEIDLSVNRAYYGERPYLDKVKFLFFSSTIDAENQYKNDSKTNGVFNSASSLANQYDYLSSRSIGLIFNVRRDALKDVAVRQKILTGGRFDQPFNLSIAALDVPVQHTKIDELSKRFSSQNITLNVSYYSTVNYPEHLAKKDFDAILYGFDFDHDRDPYPFWHSTQINAMNLSGWSDKKADIAMEDARMLADPAARNAQYDQIFTTIKNNYLVEFYPSMSYHFAVKSELKGIGLITGTNPDARFDNITKWYILEKRVRK